MRINDTLTDPDGVQARIITLPIPRHKDPSIVIQYDDGRGRVVRLADCEVVNPRDDSPAASPLSPPAVPRRTPRPGAGPCERHSERARSDG